MPHFRKEDYPLQAVAADLWDGHIFLNLSGESRRRSRTSSPTCPRSSAPGGWASSAWASRIVYDVAANWKLIIQNYSECLHCPGVHPALQKLSHFLSGENEPANPSYLGGRMDLRDGIETLSMDGKRAARLPARPGRRRTAAASTTTRVLPNLLLSLHPDYVMTHTLWPRAVDRTEIVCEWHFHPDAHRRPDFSPDDAVAFWDMTNRQDWHVCEQMQLGVGSGLPPRPLLEPRRPAPRFDRLILERERAAREKNRGEEPRITRIHTDKDNRAWAGCLPCALASQRMGVRDIERGFLPEVLKLICANSCYPWLSRFFIGVTQWWSGVHIAPIGSDAHDGSHVRPKAQVSRHRLHRLPHRHSQGVLLHGGRRGATRVARPPGPRRLHPAAAPPGARPRPRSGTRPGPWSTREGGLLVLDDSTLDKPYAKKIELVTRHWSGKHQAGRPGHQPDHAWSGPTATAIIPCDYRLYDKAKDGLTKNDHFLAMLAAAKARGFEPRCVAFDSWYSQPGEPQAGPRPAAGPS